MANPSSVTSLDDPVLLLQSIRLTLPHEGETDKYPLPDELTGHLNIERWWLR
jgi:hypothetical protein